MHEHVIDYGRRRVEAESTPEDWAGIREAHEAAEAALSALADLRYWYVSPEDVAALTRRLLALRADDVIEAVAAWLTSEAQAAGNVWTATPGWLAAQAARLRSLAEEIDRLPREPAR